jgi:uridine phosphorylase
MGDHRITNMEMETSAIYGLSEMLGHRALSINAIIANRSRGTFSKDPLAAVDKMIQNILNKV